MPKLILLIDGVVIRDVELTRQRTTLGRRPYNDIVIDHPTVSGEHAVLHWVVDSVELQDLGSTNGSYVNGKAVQRQVLASGDLLEMGRHQIRFLHDGNDTAVPTDSADLSTPLDSSNSSSSNGNGNGNTTEAPASGARVQVLTGPAAGRQMALTKVVTTIGKPGAAVASVTQRPHGFVLAQLEGPAPTLLNGNAIGTEALPLNSGDLIELAGTQMRFLQG